MRVNIENCVRHCGAKGGDKYVLTEFISNLKEMRERILKGDNSAITEFFRLYLFDDDALDIKVEIVTSPNSARDEICAAWLPKEAACAYWGACNCAALPCRNTRKLSPVA
jgi:hypothetical protein